MKTVDSEGREIKIGNRVQMPKPDYNWGDIHRCEFVGEVTEIDNDSEDNLIVVKDQDDCFSIEPERVTVMVE